MVKRLPLKRTTRVRIPSRSFSDMGFIVVSVYHCEAFGRGFDHYPDVLCLFVYDVTFNIGCPEKTLRKRDCSRRKRHRQLGRTYFIRTEGKVVTKMGPLAGDENGTASW